MFHQALVTGSNGFIGSQLVQALEAAGAKVRCAVRNSSTVPDDARVVGVGAIGPATNWSLALRDVDVVFHIAGASRRGKSDSADVFDTVNAEGSRALAEQAAAAGVKRFVLLSTIGVNGINSHDKPFTEDDTAHPASPYAASKLAAETHLRSIAGNSNMEWCVVRAPMVYGAGSPGSFARLVNLVSKRWPLPLGAAVAKRSFISVQNLISALALVGSHKNAANGVWLVSDGGDVSTADFVRSIGLALGHPVRLISVPEGIMRALGAVTGKADDINSLFNPLQIDCSRIKTRLGWTPPLRVAEAIRTAVQR